MDVIMLSLLLVLELTANRLNVKPIFYSLPERMREFLRKLS